MNYFNLAYLSFWYVMNDPFFLPAMTFTTLIAIFVGSVVYNGEVNQVRKFILSMGGYAMMLIISNLTRVLPTIPTVKLGFERPLASIVTITLVSIFYAFGLALGVIITHRAHGRKY